MGPHPLERVQKRNHSLGAAEQRAAQPESPRPQPSQMGEAGAPTAVPVPGNGSEGCSTERSVLSQAATSVSIYVILALGLPLNGLGLWVFWCRLRGWTETRVYMANLVAADCLLLLSLPGVLHTLGQAAGAQEGVLCRAVQSFYYVNTYMSICLITAIATDRYAALRFPLRSRAWRSPRQAALTCLALWLLVFGAVALPASWLRAGESFCFGRGRTRGPRTLAFSLLLFLLPLLVVSFCSWQVLRHLARKRARSPPQDAAHILRALHVVAANLATFLLCFLPLHVALLAMLVARWTDAACPTLQAVAAFVQATSRVANANCCLDAVSYYFVAKEFQEEVGAVLSTSRPFRGRMRGAPTRDHPDRAVRAWVEEDNGAGEAPRVALQRAARGAPGPPPGDSSPPLPPAACARNSLTAHV